MARSKRVEAPRAPAHAISAGRRAALFLLGATALPWSWRAAAAQAAAKVNYGLVPKLEELKDYPAAPDFTLADAQGRKVSLKDFQGKVLFLNFWASWCEACREEMPSMERLYQEFKGQGLAVVAVNVKEKAPEATAFYKKLKLTYPMLLDPEGQVGLLYGAFGLPATYLLDRKGTFLARLWGGTDWHSAGARQLMQALLERKP